MWIYKVRLMTRGYGTLDFYIPMRMVFEAAHCGALGKALQRSLAAPLDSSLGNSRPICFHAFSPSHSDTMADPFSALAGVISLVDVALRACNVLYDSITYLKDAPELSQRLQRTVQSVESVLRSLDISVAQYRQSKISFGQSDLAPDAVKQELKSIRAELDELFLLLPTSGSGNELRRRLRWVLDRKRVGEVIQRLEGHQVTLLLALQSFAQ